MSKSSINYLDVSFLIPHGFNFTTRVIKDLKPSLFKVKFEDKISSIDLACKILDRKKKPTTDEKIVELLKKICHPNIVTVHSMFQNGYLLFIFMQWMDEGNLLEFIRKNGAVEEQKAKKWFVQMISALKYLHIHRVAHSNLSCSSILIWRENIKISGLSHSHYNCDKVTKTKSLIPAFYQAPEVHSQQSYDPFIADVFSLGVILFIMLNNLIPFTAGDVAQLINDQKNRRYRIRTSFMHKLSINCQVAIHTLLEPNTNARWSIDKISNLKWIN